MIKGFIKSLPDYQALFLIILLLALLSPLFLNGSLIPGMVVLLAYTSLLVMPLLFHVSTEKFILALVFMMAFLDVPAARPYYEHESFTEILGGFLFDGLRKMTGLPIPFTLFEIVSYGLVLWIAFKHALKASRTLQVTLLVACAIPLVAWFSALLGMVRGNSLATAYTQIRFISLMSAWTVIGFFIARNFRDVRHTLRLLFVGTLFKCLYALFVFVLIFQGNLGKREFLIDHISSLTMASMLFYAFAMIYFKNLSWSRIMLWVLGAVIIVIPYVINDRRASFLGMVLALALTPFIISRYKLKKILWPLIVLCPLLVIAYGFSVLKSGADSASLSGIIAHTFASKASNLDYREIENFNLYYSIINNPIMGLGYGRAFPVILPMPDISYVFKLYDLIPHNTVLFLWAFAGPMGMAAIGVAMVVPLIACLRLAKHSKQPDVVVVAFVGFTVVIGWFCFVYFDMGILDSRAQALYGLFVGIVLHLYQQTFEGEAARNVP